MRNARILLIAVLALPGVGRAWAQRTAEPSVLVLAYNRGIFLCTVNVAIFNFGAVKADGTNTDDSFL